MTTTPDQLLQRNADRRRQQVAAMAALLGGQVAGHGEAVS